MAIQHEFEDEQLQEWRRVVQSLREKEAANAITPGANWSVDAVQG